MTVNPWEFEGIAVACGLVPPVDAIVTGAEPGTCSKTPMAHRARELPGLGVDLSATLLIDDKQANVDEFVAAGGRGFHFDRARFATEGETMLAPLVS